MKNTLRLTLMMMGVAAMGYAASIHCRDHLLEEIHDVAKNLSSKVKSEAQVPMISTDRDAVCVTQFFCLAEKALNNATEPPNAHAKYNRLRHLLNQCNKEMSHVTCSLNTTDTYSLKTLLKDIMGCSARCKRCVTA